MTRLGGITDMARRGVGRVALMSLAIGLAACGDEALTEANTSTGLGDSEASAILSDMTGDLGLSEEQKSELQQIAVEYSARLDEPGVTWYVAADVQAVLTSEQIASIAARREEMHDRISDRMSDAGFRGHGSGRGMRRDGRGPGVDGGRHRGRGPWAGGDLDLTQEQTDAIQDVLEKYRPQMEAIRDQVRDGSLTREEARTRAEAIRDSIRTEIEALLTPEQLDALEARRQEFDDRRADRQDAREQAHAAMVEALGLTAEQQAEIDALRAGPKTEGTRADTREAHRAALEAILSEEQLEVVQVHEALRALGILRRLSGGQGFGPNGGFRSPPPGGPGPGGPHPGGPGAGFGGT